MIARAALLVGTLVSWAAFAHPGNDAMAEWLRTLATPEGASCCHDRDCAPSDARLRDGEWEVPRDGGWEAVPASRVLRERNMDGRAILCRLPSGVIQCFVPPQGA